MSSLKTTHRWAVAQQNPGLEKELSAGLGIPGLVARIMVAHGIGSIKEGQLFLTPSLDRDWADPLIIPGMSVVPTASSVLFATTSTSRSLAILTLTVLRRPAC